MEKDYRLLRERLEIEQLVKKNTIKCTIIIDIITFIVLAAAMTCGRKLSMVEWIFSIILMVIIITIITLLVMTLGKRIIQNEENSKRSKEYVKAYLSKEDDVEVIPIDGKSYKKFLERKGKFYARIISDDEVGIWFQLYRDESKKELLEKVDKSDFKNCWLVEAIVL